MGYSWLPHKIWSVSLSFLATLLISISIVMPQSASAIGVSPDNAAWLIFDKKYNDYFLLRVDMKTSRVGSAWIAGGNRYAGRRFTGEYARFDLNLLGGQFTVSKSGARPFMVASFNKAGDEIYGSFLDAEGKNIGEFIGALKGHTDHQMDLFQICRFDADSKYYCANRGRDEACGVGSYRRSSTFFSRANCEDEIWRSSLQREDSYVSLGSLKKQTEYLSCRTINGDINGFHEEYAYKEDGRRLWSTYYSKDFLVGPTRRYNEQGLLELLSWRDDYPLARLQVLKFSYSVDQKLETVEHRYPHPVGKGYWDRVWNKNGELVSEVCTGAEDCSASTKDEIYSSQELTIYNNETASVWLGTKSEGVRDGRAIMAFSSGALRFLSYRAGKLDGDYIHYYSNSGQVQISKYSNGKLEPSYVVRHPCGKEEKKERKPSKTQSSKDSSVPTSSSTERQALVAFFEATGGSQWKNNDGWLSDKDHCDWFGIRCWKNKKVQSLSLEDNGLIGTITQEIGELTQLQTLNLSKNKLEGSLPSSMSALSRLHYLMLNNNRLSGELPASLGIDSPRLGTIRLQKNEFTGPIPRSIGELKDLTSISLSHNLLTGSLPDWFPKMQKLRNAYIDYNKLSGVISEDVAESYAKARADNSAYYRLLGNDFDCPQPLAIGDIFAAHGEFCVAGKRSRGYSGQLTANYSNGKKLYESGFIDGKRHGIGRYWFDNGQLFLEWQWDRGKREGFTKVWYSSGQIKYEIPFAKGRKHGLRREWDSAGQEKPQECWIDGKKAELELCDSLIAVTRSANDDLGGARTLASETDSEESVGSVTADRSTTPTAADTNPRESLTDSENGQATRGSESINSELAAIVAELNKSKRTVNDEYELSSVSMGEVKRELIYEFDVKTSISDLNEPLLTTVAKSVYCSAEKLQIFRDNNIPAVWIYTDRSASSMLIRTETYDCE